MYKTGQAVCAEICLGNGQSEWRLAVVLREDEECVAVKVPVLADPREEFSSPKKRRRSFLRKKQEEDGTIEEYEYSGILALPSNSLAVLFARISSESFLRSLLSRMERREVFWKEQKIEKKRICEADPEKLFRRIDWKKYCNI